MEKTTLEVLVNKKLSSHQIAKEVNKAQTTIRYWLRKHNLKTDYTAHKVEIKDGKKVCTKCFKNKKLDQYYQRQGRLTLHPSCIDCMIQTTIKRQQSIKIKSVEYKGGECEICGYKKYIGALQFHHKDPTEKDIKWTNFKLRSFDDRMKKELDKCLLLCANCHCEEHERIRNKIK